MANNTNKRIPVKWIRDRAKAAYDKKDCCFICATTQELELHHTHSVTLLLERWVNIKGYDISTDEGILAVRDEFIDDHRKELYDDVFTLCNKHHVALHAIYGKAPALNSALKQITWIDRQRAKYLDGYVAPVTSRPELSLYGQFLT
jgi:hypothetical protein